MASNFLELKKDDFKLKKHKFWENNICIMMNLSKEKILMILIAVKT